MKLAIRPKNSPDRHAKRHGVADLHRTQVIFAAIEVACEDHAQHAAVEGHAAIPDADDVARIGEIEGGFIKQHIAKTAAEDHTKDDPAEQILDLTWLDRGGVVWARERGA